MNVVGRKEEIKIMTELLMKKEAQFLAIYGRRRVGKTYLIRNVYKTSMVFECTGIQNITLDEQLENFWIALITVDKTQRKKPESWLEAFQMLASILEKKKRRKKKLVIFLDEISWFDSPKSRFKSSLSHFWNSYAVKNPNILLVICGSAASWILNHVVNNKGGLHNRLTRTIRLLPFDLQEFEQMLKIEGVKLSRFDVTQLYMCIGGIPYYIKQISSGKSVAQILDELFFNKSASLKSEFENLYASLFTNHKLHEELVALLASKRKGLNRSTIIKKTSMKSGGGLTEVLKELEECGFIMTTHDFHKRKEDVLYRLIDEYTIFYLKFLKNKRGKTSGRQLLNSQSFRIWAGFAFENFCFKHIHLINRVLGIHGIEYDLFSFIEKGTKDGKGIQIDLIIDRADNVVNIFEIKFYNLEFNLSLAQSKQILHKVNRFREITKTRKNIFTTLITSNGAIKNKNYHSAITNDITLQQILKT